MMKQILMKIISIFGNHMTKQKVVLIMKEKNILEMNQDMMRIFLFIQKEFKNSGLILFFNKKIFHLNIIIIILMKIMN